MVYDKNFQLLNTVDIDCGKYIYSEDCVLVGAGDKMFFRSVDFVDTDNDGQPDSEVHLLRYIDKSEMLNSKTKLSMTTAYEKNIEV